MEMDDDAKVAYHCDFKKLYGKGRINEVTLMQIASYAVIYATDGVSPDGSIIRMQPRKLFEWFNGHRTVID